VPSENDPGRDLRREETRRIAGIYGFVDDDVSLQLKMM